MTKAFLSLTLGPCFLRDSPDSYDKTPYLPCIPPENWKRRAAFGRLAQLGGVLPHTSDGFGIHQGRPAALNRGIRNEEVAVCRMWLYL